ncbi:MAG TPA: helix-turn-helix transcriptional regulator [Solirubrobacterales bacterium]|nr:helix-turn-helix transcriptional regulator [Solirubrobacterales bacterium]
MRGQLAEQFGANLQRSRRRAGLSQVGLGELVRVHRSEIGHLERGERLPRLDTILKLAAGLDTPVSVLLAGLHWLPGHYVEGGFSVEDTWHTMARAASSGERA